MISTGCAWTVGVAGVYCSSSIRSLRSTTLPGVTASSWPGRNVTPSCGGLPAAPASRSRHQSVTPPARFAPPVSTVRLSTSGLVQTKLVGLTTSSACRAVKVTIRSWCRVTPVTWLVAFHSHCWVSRNDWWIRLNGHCCQAGSANRRSCGSGSMHGGASPCVHSVAYSAKRAALRCALLASSICLPGAAARCQYQSAQADTSDGQAMPRLARATAARIARS